MIFDVKILLDLNPSSGRRGSVVERVLERSLKRLEKSLSKYGDNVTVRLVGKTLGGSPRGPKGPPPEVKITILPEAPET